MAGLIADSSQAARFVFTLRRQGVTDKRILGVLEAVSRAGFTPPGLTGVSNADCVVPIACGQNIPRPVVIAQLLAALDLSPGRRDRVLLVGAGSGYTAALLSRVSLYVYGVERYVGLIEAAQESLARIGVDNVGLCHGDGLAGLAEHAPFDRILLTGATGDVPDTLVQQLAADGRLVAAVEGDDGVQVLKTVAANRSGDGACLIEPLTRLQPGISRFL